MNGLNINKQDKKVIEFYRKICENKYGKNKVLLEFVKPKIFGHKKVKANVRGKDMEFDLMAEFDSSLPIGKALKLFLEAIEKKIVDNFFNNEN